MKKILILTLTFIISTSSFIGCNNTQPSEQPKQTSEETSTNKQEIKETPKQPDKTNDNESKKTDSKQSKKTATTTPKEIETDKSKDTNNTESKPKESSNDNLELLGIGSVETDDGFNYTLKSLGNYSRDKLYVDSKNNLHGFIVKDTSIKNPNINNFKYNEFISSDGHIKYPSFLKLNKRFVPVADIGFVFVDSSNQIDFRFVVDEPHIDPQTNENYSVDHICKILTDASLNPNRKITYKAKGKNWVCVSYEENGLVTYYFEKLSKDLNRIFSYTYPKKYEKEFDPIIQESYNSFKTDDIVKNN